MSNVITVIMLNYVFGFVLWAAIVLEKYGELRKLARIPEGDENSREIRTIVHEMGRWSLVALFGVLGLWIAWAFISLKGFISLVGDLASPEIGDMWYSIRETAYRYRKAKRKEKADALHTVQLDTPEELAAFTADRRTTSQHTNE
jgi:hypothetical protein